MNERIDNKYLTASHRPGEVILAEDMNELESVVKAGINANYEDIQKIEDGTIMVGNASQLQGATLSTYSDSELSDDDNKFPSSRQVKRYIDAADIELGATLDLSIDSDTYVVTATLKNSSGTALSTKTIDLPLETMVVSGEYDSDTKEVVLTLDNGNTIRFSVADLISGLQSEITSSNKLDSDLVDDTGQTNKFITASGLTKLSGIETGAQVNIIESITVNGTPLTITSKGVSFTVPTKVSDLSNDSGFITKSVNDLTNYTLSSALSTVATSGSYTDLSNKPTIPTATSDLSNDSGFITKSVDDLTNYTDTTTLNTALGGKQETLVSGTNIKTINNYSLLGSGNITIESSGGTANYDELENRPQINSTTLTGNKSLSDLGIQPAGNYLTSESDPVFTASAAHGISSSDITSWDGKLDSSKVKTSNSTTSGDVYDVTYINTGLSGKLDTSKVKSTNSTTSGDVYDVTYVNGYRPISESLTLTTSGWELNALTNLYEYEVTNANVTINHRVDLILDIANQAKFEGSAYTQSFTGSYTIYTDTLPTEAISCTAYITKVGV